MGAQQKGTREANGGRKVKVTTNLGSAANALGSSPGSNRYSLSKPCRLSGGRLRGSRLLRWQISPRFCGVHIPVERCNQENKTSGKLHIRTCAVNAAWGLAEGHCEGMARELTLHHCHHPRHHDHHHCQQDIATIITQL
jgi:hypothetical protein